MSKTSEIVKNDLVQVARGSTDTNNLSCTAEAMQLELDIAPVDCEATILDLLIRAEHLAKTLLVYPARMACMNMHLKPCPHPETWPEAFPTCGGQSQSPIKIHPQDARPVKFSRLNYNKYWVGLNNNLALLTNTGYSVEIVLNRTEGEEPYLTGGPLPPDNVYKLAQIHFHWGKSNIRGSEHIIVPFESALEVHLVHYNSKYESLERALGKLDGVAIVAILFMVSHPLEVVIVAILFMVSHPLGVAIVAILFMVSHPLEVAIVAILFMVSHPLEVAIVAILFMVSHPLEVAIVTILFMVSHPLGVDIVTILFMILIRVLDLKTPMFTEYRETSEVLKNLTDSLYKVTEPETAAWLDESVAINWLDKDIIKKVYFTYMGSLTTPPCVENVTWIVYNQHMEVTPNQVGAFRKLRTTFNNELSTNIRLTQDLNNRPLFLSDPNAKETLSSLLEGLGASGANWDSNEPKITTPTTASVDLPTSYQELEGELYSERACANLFWAP
ncbi:unnamed protein product [Timema podura]|uniref:carbonic anhydrase n=1 Tax=Timema podura TaxID=61482 RepID=A0ABN7NKM4_TIMPD|nr:unnamed protein product [Timema podura]